MTAPQDREALAGVEQRVSLSRVARRTDTPVALLLELCSAAGIEVIEFRKLGSTRARYLVHESDVLELLRKNRRRTAAEEGKRVDLALDLAMRQLGITPTRRRRT